MERIVSRGRDLVASLGSRQLARRSLRYTRSALLLMLAMSMGVFALSYAATWSSSQRDQAEYQTGAEVRVLPGSSSGGLPGWALPHAYAGLAGVGRVSPLERITDGIQLAASGSTDLLALDADTAAGIVLLRSDESAEPLGELMRALREGRPEPTLATLPEGAAYLRIVPRLDIGSIAMLVFDPDTGDDQLVPFDPGTQVDLRVSASAIVVDAHGLLYRVDSDLVPVEGPTTSLLLPLVGTAQVSDGGASPVGARLDGPIRLAGLGVDLWLPAGSVTSDSVVGVSEASAAVGVAGPWTRGAARIGRRLAGEDGTEVPRACRRARQPDAGPCGAARHPGPERHHLRQRNERPGCPARLRARLGRLVSRRGAGDRQSRLPGCHRLGAG